mgnify:FL=1
MMLCGLAYNWHLFYYPSLVETFLNEDSNETFTYCNIIFGRQMGYFSFGGFQSIQELIYNAPVVNFIVSSLIPFTIVAATNLVIILRVLKRPRKNTCAQLENGLRRTDLLRRSSLRHARTDLTRKDLSYETTITLTTSFVFLTTNSIASIYVYVKSSYRPKYSRITEEIKTSNVYLILRMLSLIDTVLEFYIYFLTGRKFRQDVYNVIGEILQYTPLKNYFKFSRLNDTNTSITNYNHDTRHIDQQKYDDNPPEQQLIDGPKATQYLTLTHSANTSMSRIDSCLDGENRPNITDSENCDFDETVNRMESTV